MAKELERDNMKIYSYSLLCMKIRWKVVLFMHKFRYHGLDYISLLFISYIFFLSHSTVNGEDGECVSKKCSRYDGTGGRNGENTRIVC